MKGDVDRGAGIPRGRRAEKRGLGDGVWPCPGATEEAMTGSGPAGNWSIES